MSISGLINREALLYVPNVRKVTEYDETGCGMDYLAVPVDAILAAPAVDTAPVVHAKWGKPIEYGLPYAANHLGVVCSYCCKWSDNKYNFCPNCGTKMDGGDEQ